MKDTLYRQDVIKALICADENIGKNTCIGIIKRLPSAPSERKKGEWIKVNPHIVICPFCKHASSPKNFCSDCGADMRGKDNG